MSIKNKSDKEGQKRVNISIAPQTHADAIEYAETVGQDFSGLLAQLLLREMRDRTLYAAGDKSVVHAGKITHPKSKTRSTDSQSGLAAS